MRAKDINTKRGAWQGENSALEFCCCSRNAGKWKAQVRKWKTEWKMQRENIFSGREHNNSSLRGAASLRSTASSSAIFNAYRMREISRRCFVWLQNYTKKINFVNDRSIIFTNLIFKETIYKIQILCLNVFIIYG